MACFIQAGIRNKNGRDASSGWRRNGLENSNLNPPIGKQNGANGLRKIMAGWKTL
jgi:hypothetical protein